MTLSAEGKNPDKHYTRVSKEEKEQDRASKAAEKVEELRSLDHARQQADALTNQRLFQDERRSDPTGIGFAYGGVLPGRLHARGKPHETHKVYFSVGQVGSYELHVALREQSVPLHGSPFALEVVAGPASALGTEVSLAHGPLAGTVGIEEGWPDKGGLGLGCSLVLQSADKCGNACTVGGEKVECEAEVVRSKSWEAEQAAAAAMVAREAVPIGRRKEEIKWEVVTHVKDTSDGRYSLYWRSKQSGAFRAHVKIDGKPVIGSPFPIRFLADRPVLSKTIVKGSGLKEVRAVVPPRSPALLDTPLPPPLPPPLPQPFHRPCSTALCLRRARASWLWRTCMRRCRQATRRR